MFQIKVAVNWKLFVIDDSRPWMPCAAGPVMTNYFNSGIYCYSPWQPVYYVGRSVVPLSQLSSTVASPAAVRRVSCKLTCLIFLKLSFVMP